MVTTTILDAGVVRPIHKGAWASTATYEASNIVSYDGSSWMMSAPSYTVGTTPTEGATWKMLAQKGAAYMDSATTTTAGITMLASDAEITAGTNTTKIVTPKNLSDKVSAEIADLVNSAPEALNTLNELAAALGDDPNFATTVATQIGTVSTSAATAQSAAEAAQADATQAISDAADAQATADAIATTDSLGRVSVNGGLSITDAGALSISMDVQDVIDNASAMLDDVSIDAAALSIVRSNSSGKVEVGYLPVISGATSTTDGTAGIAPQPVAGDENKVLYGDGTFKVLPTASPTSGGVIKSSDSIHVDSSSGVATVPQVSPLEAFRISRIGVPSPVASTTIDDSFMWADGSLVLLADYPELQEKYVAGGLMVLDADSTAVQQAAKPLYFVANTEGTGLYLPRLNGLFARTWTGEDDGTVGGYNTAGLPNITGSVSSGRSGFYSGTGALSGTNNNGNSEGAFAAYGTGTLAFNASGANSIYGSSATVMPASWNQPYAVYLGKYIPTSSETE